MAPIHAAAEKGHREIVELLLKQGESVNVVDANGRTPLYFAVKGKHVECVKFILKWKPDVNISTQVKEISPLHMAVYYGITEISSELIENGAILTAKDKNGFTALHLACEYGHLNIVELLCQQTAALNEYLNSQSKDGRTALHWCCYNEHIDCVNRLLQAGAKLDIRDNKGDTPAKLCQNYKLLGCLAKLKLAGDTIDLTECSYSILHESCMQQIDELYPFIIQSTEDINSVDHKGQTVLHIACDHESEKMIQRILEKRPKLELKRRSDLFTPLHVACYKGNQVIVNQLLNCRASVSETSADKKTALHIACEQKHVSIVDQLLENKASLFPRTEKDKFTPLHFACKNDDIDSVKLILDHMKEKKLGTKPLMVIDIDGRTPLLTACFYSASKPLVNLLVDVKSKPGDIDLNGNNALHLACLSKAVGIAEYLADKVNINATNNDNNTALHLACIEDDVELVRVLITKGPSIMIVNNQNKTAVDLAKSKKIQKILKGEYGASNMAEEFYPLSKNKPRGICLILNNEKFENQGQRFGSDCDAQSINRLFSEYNYEIQAEYNLNSSEMQKLVQDVAQKDHSKNDSFVMFILSHGSKGVVNGSDGLTVKIKTLIEPLYRCTSLQDKPKLIFIQACRGSKMNRTDSSGKSKAFDKGDFLTAFGTASDDASLRQRDGQGSYFIQVLIKKLKQFGHCKDIHPILTVVNKTVRNQVNEEEHVDQVPEYVTTLSKLFKFL